MTGDFSDQRVPLRNRKPVTGSSATIPYAVKSCYPSVVFRLQLHRPDESILLFDRDPRDFEGSYSFTQVYKVIVFVAGYPTIRFTPLSIETNPRVEKRQYFSLRKMEK